MLGSQGIVVKCIAFFVPIRHIHKWRTRKETVGPSACKRGLRGIVALFSFVFLPHKPRLHALGPIVLRLSAIYEYGVLAVLGSQGIVVKCMAFFVPIGRVRFARNCGKMNSCHLFWYGQFCSCETYFVAK